MSSSTGPSASSRRATAKRSASCRRSCIGPSSSSRRAFERARSPAPGGASLALAGDRGGRAAPFFARPILWTRSSMSPTGSESSATAALPTSTPSSACASVHSGTSRSCSASTSTGARSRSSTACASTTQGKHHPALGAGDCDGRRRQRGSCIQRGRSRLATGRPRGVFLELYEEPELPVELTRRGLLDHRRALIGWCLGVIGYAAADVLDLPVDQGLGRLREAPRALPGRAGVAVRDRCGRLHHGRRLPRRGAVQPDAPAVRARARDQLGRADVRGRGGAGPPRPRAGIPSGARAVLAKGAAVAGEVGSSARSASRRSSCSSRLRARPRSLAPSPARSSGSLRSASSTGGSRSRSEPRSRAGARARRPRGVRGGRLSRRRPPQPRRLARSRSASSRRSGSSARRRCRTASTAGGRSLSFSPPSSRSPGAVLVERRDLKVP